MRNRISILIYFIFISFFSSAQPYGNSHQEAPKVVVGIVIENMRPDYIQRYWNKFQEDGFKKLYTKGTVCSNFKIDQHVQNYASGMATLYTGVNPSVHGIIDQKWYDRLKSKEVGCVADEYYMTVGSDTKEGNVSPKNLMSNTIGDILKISSQGKSKVFSLALNSSTAALSAGHAADGAFWFDTKSGRMVSSSFYINLFPDWVRIFNSNGFAEQYSYRNWTTLLPITSYTESLEDDYLLEQGYSKKWNTFPHTVTKYVKNGNNYAPLKTTPFGNVLIHDFATELLKNEELGTDEYADLLTIVFSSMDYENGSFGPNSVEMEDIYLRIDQHIASLLNSFDQKFGSGNYLVFLTSNTSASYPVDYLKEEFKLTVGSFSPESAFALLTSYLNITYGDEKWIESITGQQVYFNHKLIEQKKLDLEKMVESAAKFINQFEGVRAALPSHILEKGASAFSANSEMYMSFRKNRSGDFGYILEEGWQPLYKYNKINYTDQTHIPLVFYGKYIQPKIITSHYSATDLVPTLSHALRIPAPDKSKGNIIEGIFE